MAISNVDTQIRNPILIRQVIKRLIDYLLKIKDTTGEFLLHLPDGQTVDTKGWQGWDWTQGIGLYGIWRYHELTGDEDALRIVEEWFQNHLTESWSFVSKNVNTMAVFLTLACIYETDPKPTYLPYLESWAEWAMHDLPRTKHGGMQHVTLDLKNDQQLWDDTLMMAALPLAKIGMVLQRPRYVEEAKKQFLVHIKYLFDSRSGFFFHGWTFADGGHNFAKALWARGNSWLTIAIPEFLELLGLAENDEFRILLSNTLDAQCDALKNHQDASGLWSTLLDKPVEEGSYLEASATAGFAYGMLKARRMGYIGSEYDEVAFVAIRGLLANVTVEGELQNVSFGTPMGHTLDFYLNIPRTSMPYGQAMAIMALGEVLRTIEKI